MAWFQHESAIVDDGATIGDRTKVWHFCHVSRGSQIGVDCVLGQNVYVASTAVIGDRVRVQNNVSIYDGVMLDDDVFVGPSAVFTNVRNPRSEVPRKHAYEPTHVEVGATIGANATIVCGVRIGRYALIGAGAVVARDVPAFALMLGVPARHAGWVCRCGIRLEVVDALATCTACRMHYREAGYELLEES